MALRFCMITTFYPPYHFGGDGIFVHRLAHALAERGHTVDVVHSIDAYRPRHRPDSKGELADHPNVRVRPLARRWPLGAALAAHQTGSPAFYSRELRVILASGKYDVIHYHNVSLMGGPGILQLGRAVKLYTPHEYWLVCPTHVLFKFNREACVRKNCLSCTLHSRRPPQIWRYTGAIQRYIRNVDCFLMPSRFAMDIHRSAGIGGRMVHLPNFVSSPSSQAPAETGGPPYRPYFLFVGRLEKLKGVRDLPRLFGSYPEADLLVAGTGSDGPILEALCKSLPNVKLLGHVEPSALERLYRGAVAVIIPSLCYEVFPLIAVESLVHGTPLIVRRIGALTEIVEESRAGYTFTTMAECAEAMERLRRDPDLRAELGERGRKTAITKWSTEVHLDRYLGLVRSLVERRPT